MFVSILLLLELAFEAYSTEAAAVQGYTFQSFFYWNWLSKRHTAQQTFLRCRVSILLLLELAFEAQMKNVHAILARCFNPSSIGIGFRSPVSF